MNLCGYRNCHNLANRIYEGYCSEEHRERAIRDAAKNKDMMEEHEKRKRLAEAEATKREKTEESKK